ncbi:MAG: immunoglobulin domain-containing protein, partial [bacterium]
MTGLGDDNAQFRVVVSNSAGSVTSSAAVLRVNARPRPPTLTAQPMSMSVAELNSVTLSVAVEGTPPFTYQWQRSPDGASYADIAGATGESYTTPLLSRADSGVRYRVIVSNVTAQPVTSAAAQITVNADA